MSCGRRSALSLPSLLQRDLAHGPTAWDFAPSACPQAALFPAARAEENPVRTMSGRKGTPRAAVHEGTELRLQSSKAGSQYAQRISYARDDLVLPHAQGRRALVDVLHENYLACATGRVLLIFVRFCCAAPRVTLWCQVADFDFSFLLFRRIRLACFVRHTLHLPRTPSTARRLHIGTKMQNRYYVGYGIYSKLQAGLRRFGALLSS